MRAVREGTQIAEKFFFFRLFVKEGQVLTQTLQPG